jgi:hypothetical protein
MPEYSWRRRATTHFGVVWVPYAEVGIQRSNGRFQAFALQVDSGAVVSLLRRSVAELLGIELESGRKIELATIGGGKTRAHVHELLSRFDDGMQLTVPYAIADTEDVPNLLGRRGVFDVLQVDFDASLEQTRVTGAWLDENGRRIWRFLLETDRYILDRKRWSSHRLPGRADEAAGVLVRRGAQVMTAIAGLLKLHRGFECPPLIRSLLELSMQLEFLLKDPTSRAEQYLDFEHITKYEQVQALVKAPVGTIARRIAYSPDRLSGEPRLKRNYDRVRARFARGKSQTWPSWHCMTVHDLAKEVSRLPEYKFWYKMSSGWMHGDPFQSREHQLLKPPAVLIASICYYARMLLQIAEAKKIVLTNEQYEVLRECEQGVI